MFVSYSFIEKGKVLANKNYIKMSPEFRTWFTSLNSDDQEQVRMTAYACCYAKVNGILDDMMSLSAQQLRWRIDKVKASPKFMNWYNKADKTIQTVVKDRVKKFKDNPYFNGKEHFRIPNKGKKATAEILPNNDLRLYVSIYNPGNILALIDGGNKSDQKAKQGEKADDLVNRSDFDPTDWEDFL